MLTELDAINKWTKCNQLRLNVSKSNYIVFHNRSIKIDMPPVRLDGTELERVCCTKFLGVYIDECINWNYHINLVTSKISKICGILYRVRNNLTPEALISIYYTLCYPHLIYCLSVWSCTWQSFLKKLTVAQNKIFRCMFFMSKFESTKDVLYRYNFLSFSNIQKYFVLLFIYKCITHFQGMQPFRLVATCHRTRSNNLNLVCPQFRTTAFQNSLLYYGPQLWNSLPMHIKGLVNNGSLSLFKRSVKSHFYVLQNS